MSSETSAKNFMPKLLPLIDKIPCVYARSIFDSSGADSPKRKGNAGAPGMFGNPLKSKMSQISAKLAGQQNPTPSTALKGVAAYICLAFPT